MSAPATQNKRHNYASLLEKDEDFRRRYENHRRRSPVVADEKLRRIGYDCLVLNTTAKKTLLDWLLILHFSVHRTCLYKKRETCQDRQMHLQKDSEPGNSAELNPIGSKVYQKGSSPAS